jgi:hypothetical protein
MITEAGGPDNRRVAQDELVATCARPPPSRKHT